MSVPELGMCEVTNSGISDDIVIVGMAEVDSFPVLVSIEKVVCGSPWEKLGLVLEKGAVVPASELVSREVTSPDAPEETDGVVVE